MGATKMDKMLIKAYKMLEEKGQHVINPANEDTILKTAGPVVDAGQSTGIGIWSVGMAALMWRCLPNTTRKELLTTNWFTNMKLDRAHARGAKPPAALQHLLLLSYAAGETEGRGQDRRGS